MIASVWELLTGGMVSSFANGSGIMMAVGFVVESVELMVA
jgi:hypothetical protein